MLVARAIAWLILVGLGGLLVARALAHDASMVLIWSSTFAPYVYLPAWGILLGALAARDAAMAASAAAICAAHLGFVLPDLRPAQGDPGRITDARIFSANLLMVHPEPSPLLAELIAADADVILLQEYSPLWEVELDEAGVLADYPYQVGVVREDSFGTAILSRTPLSNEEVWMSEGLPMTRATVDLGGLGLRVYNVHPLPPRTREYTAAFERQMAALESELAADPALGGSLIAAGDFNITQRARWMKRLTDLGLRSAHADRGRGTATTFPNGLFPLPPVRLDHALISEGLGCVSISEGEGRGSDHRPLTINLVLR